MICDANIVVRYLLNDVPEHADKVSDLIERKQIFIPFEVFAEVVYVLEKVYNVGRQELCDSLLNIIGYSNVETLDKQVLEYALNLFSQTRMDFVDTLLCGYCHVQHEDIVTFDRKLKNRIKKIQSTF
jgi:predicted nucleic-acid-binding protein